MIRKPGQGAILVGRSSQRTILPSTGSSSRPAVSHDESVDGAQDRATNGLPPPRIACPLARYVKGRACPQGAVSTRAGARLRDMRKRGSRRRTCIVFFFFFCLSASSVHEHRSAKLDFPQAKVANGVCERRYRRSHLSEIATGNSCHAGVCIIPRPALARRLGLQIVVEAR